jgi:hypothetical protein
MPIRFSRQRAAAVPGRAPLRPRSRRHRGLRSCDAVPRPQRAAPHRSTAGASNPQKSPARTRISWSPGGVPCRHLRHARAPATPAGARRFSLDLACLLSSPRRTRFFDRDDAHQVALADHGVGGRSVMRPRPGPFVGRHGERRRTLAVSLIRGRTSGRKRDLARVVAPRPPISAPASAPASAPMAFGHDPDGLEHRAASRRPTTHRAPRQVLRASPAPRK